MWLLSSSSSANKDWHSDARSCAKNVESSLVDEESTIESTPQTSYSAGHTSNSNGTMNGSTAAAAAAAAALDDKVDIILSAMHSNQLANQSQNQRHNNKPKRGMIYFRSIIPADRTVIQILHEQWFPVDYKNDFFDSLCSERPLQLGGLNSPLYCCVACFRELGEAEWDERVRRRKEHEEETDNNNNGSGRWSSLFFGRSSEKKSNTTENEDYILWEADEDADASTAEDDTRNTSSSDNNSSYQDSTTVNGYTSQSQELQNTTETNGSKDIDTEAQDVIENGESVFSIAHRMEKERMERFYTNGFQFDPEDDRSSWHKPASNTTGTNNNGKNSDRNNKSNNQANNKKNNNEGPYYNDNGEHIIGCIVGSFLSSTMPSSKHRSTLDEKIGRDETAELLVPDSTRYSKMFYIMTLGTTREFRRYGLGSVLVNRVVDMIEEQEECGALYLHVITYNDGAIRLYEQLGFSRVKEIKGMYHTFRLWHYVCCGFLSCQETDDKLIDFVRICPMKIITLSTLFSTIATFIHVSFMVSLTY